MKKILLSISLIILVIVSKLSAQSSFNSEMDQESIYSRSDVLTRASLSFVPLLTTLTGIGSLDSMEIVDLDLPAWMIATMSTQHLPLYLTDKQKAMKYSAFELGSLGLHLATKDETFFTYMPFHYFLYSGWYSSYDNYSAMRNQSDYAGGWQSYGMGELLHASFDKDVITRRFFWVTILTTTTLNLLGSDSSKTSIWKSGEAYIDGKKYDPAVALPLVFVVNTIKFTATAVAEEALFRGIIYEELKYSFGSKKAKIADIILFPAIHVLGDLTSNKDSDEVIGLFIIRGISTLLFDFAYDRGGLPLSIALHTWFNTLGQTIQWTKERGVPSSITGSGGSSLIPPFHIGFSINF